jgi:N-acetylmuramoyl-L-alanine amidase
MPSILIETAFLSNPTEEKKLRTPSHQNKLARAVFSGIQNHLRNRQA